VEGPIESKAQHYDEQYNIFYARCSIREVPLAPSRKTEGKSNHLVMKEGSAEAPFYTNAGEKNTKDGAARSVQPPKIQHS